jgi:Co/Zn/Cd efflux system component
MSEPEEGIQSRLLVTLLVVNALMFLIEVVVGWLAQSTVLLADSLDMLADAAVYGIALIAVGRFDRFKSERPSAVASSSFCWLWR